MNGLNNHDTKVFLDLLIKANTPQLKAMWRELFHEQQRRLKREIDILKKKKEELLKQ